MGDYVRYMARTPRCRIGAQGFEEAFRWANFEEAPFTPLPGPLRDCVVALVTTASPVWTGDPELRPLPEVFSMSTPMPHRGAAPAH